MLDMLILGGVIWLLQFLVENHYSSRLIGEAIKRRLWWLGVPDFKGYFPQRYQLIYSWN